MNRWRLKIQQITAQFWFLPAVMTLAALFLAELGINLEESYGVPDKLNFVYGGGETGARSLLSAIASSSIGVAGTVFSITIAALSYAAGTMGPRLLIHFTSDRGNQLTLGTFISTFAFSLYTLRNVQGGDPPFVPHYNTTLALVLALACIGMLVYYLAHITRTLSMTRVVNLLRNDMRASLLRATRAHEKEGAEGELEAPPENFWEGAERLRAPNSGYLQLLDIEMLIAKARQADVAVRLLARPGDYVFPQTVIALGLPRLPEGLMEALTLGDNRTTTGQDLEYTIRQLTEVAARALSPGINDPMTAIDVIDRFGDALCSLQDRRWPNGVHYVENQLRLVVPVTDFAGLVASMFDMIRQYGKDSPSVTIRLLEVLTVTATCLDDQERRAVIRRHADLVYEDALRVTQNSGDRADIEERYRALRLLLRSHEEVVRR